MLCVPLRCIWCHCFTALSLILHTMQSTIIVISGYQPLHLFEGGSLRFWVYDNSTPIVSINPKMPEACAKYGCPSLGLSCLMPLTSCMCCHCFQLCSSSLCSTPSDPSMLARMWLLPSLLPMICHCRRQTWVCAWLLYNTLLIAIGSLVLSYSSPGD